MRLSSGRPAVRAAAGPASPQVGRRLTNLLQERNRSPGSNASARATPAEVLFRPPGAAGPDTARRAGTLPAPGPDARPANGTATDLPGPTATLDPSRTGAHAPAADGPADGAPPRRPRPVVPGYEIL